MLTLTTVERWTTLLDGKSGRLEPVAGLAQDVIVGPGMGRVIRRYGADQRGAGVAAWCAQIGVFRAASCVELTGHEVGSGAAGWSAQDGQGGHVVGRAVTHGGEQGLCLRGLR
jgi:hypothetical protein